MTAEYDDYEKSVELDMYIIMVVIIPSIFITALIWSIPLMLGWI